MSAEATTKPKTPVTFPCSGCGGPMLFDSSSQSLKCEYCGKEDPIENSDQLPVEHDLDLTEADDPELTDWGMRTQTVRCEQCGGESLIPQIETAARCAFCGSPKVLAGEASAGIRPETMIPFQVSLDQATASFHAWKKKRWFIPNEFKRGKIVSRLTGIYIPYWTYDSETASVYSAERGDYHYRNEKRTRVVNGKTETYTERVRYTVWRRVGGQYDYSFDDILIPASVRYDRDLLEDLGNFDLRKLTGYQPEYLSGYTAEKYSVTCQQGWQRARNSINDTLRANIREEIGGDEIRSLNIRTQYYDRTYKHVLLPVWNANYTYRTKPYRYMVNGQTGLVSGTVPRSPWKITFFVLLCVIAAAAAFILFTQYNG